MKNLLHNEQDFECFKMSLMNVHAHPCTKPEAYPCIIVWEQHDRDGYGGFYIDYEYIYPEDFEGY